MSEINETGFSQSNDGYTNASVISIRLDTGPMLDSIEAFLRGKIIKGWEEGEGGLKPVYGGSGVPLANNEGVQGILSFLTPLFSAHTVQGNRSRDEFTDFMVRLEIDLITYVMTNLHNWNIKIENFQGIIDTIIDTAEMFFSRTIDNKERESYGLSMRSVESVKESGGGNWLTPWKN